MKKYQPPKKRSFEAMSLRGFVAKVIPDRRKVQKRAKKFTVRDVG